MRVLLVHPARRALRYEIRQADRAPRQRVDPGRLYVVRPRAHRDACLALRH